VFILDGQTVHVQLAPTDGNLIYLMKESHHQRDDTGLDVDAGEEVSEVVGDVGQVVNHLLHAQEHPQWLPSTTNQQVICILNESQPKLKEVVGDLIFLVGI